MNTLENALWRKSKSPMVNEYLQTVKQVEDKVAMQGFLYRPGFLGDMVTRVETILKYKLSDINYNIVKEAIERELAQTGYDYDITIKNAMIAWELEKTLALTSLEEEFGRNKLSRDLDKQDKERLEMIVNLRKLVIMAAKTAIDVAMEAARREMLGADASTYPAENALLAAQLVTANKKLTIIPYIQEVLAKQQAIITVEYANADRKRALMTEKEKLVDKKGELITAKEAIAEAILELLAAKQIVVDKKYDLVDAKARIVDQEETNLTYLEQYLLAIGGLVSVKQGLITAKKNLLPFINEKSATMIAYATELDAWVIVKNSIAAVKEQIASLMETRVDKKGNDS